MSIRVLFVTESTPHDRHGGGGVTELGIAHALGKIPGVSVSLFSLQDGRNLHGANSEEIWSALVETFDSVVVASKSDGFNPEIGKRGTFSILGVRFSIQKFRVGFSYTRKLREYAGSEKFDLLVSYGWDAAQASTRTHLPKIALLGDPLGLPYRYRRKLFPNPKWRLRHRLLLAIEDLTIRVWSVFSCRRTLRAFSYVGAFASQHAKYYQSLSGRPVEYIPTPIEVPPVDSSGDMAKTPDPARMRLRLGMIGHLNGTATLQGLVEFHANLAGGLAAPIGEGSVTLEIAGGYLESLPEALRTSLEAYGVFFSGQVWPPELFFRRIDVLLVPTSIPLGIRVRILTAWNFGIPVLAHEMNAQGIPELIDGRNSFLYRSPDEFHAKLGLLRISEVRDSLVEGGKETVSDRFSLGEHSGASWLFEHVTSLAESRNLATGGGRKRFFHPNLCAKVGPARRVLS